MAAALGFALAIGGGAAPALAHDAGPCNDSGEPGNSDYAQHHIKPAAQDGALGEGGQARHPSGLLRLQVITAAWVRCAVSCTHATVSDLPDAVLGIRDVVSDVHIAIAALARC